MKTQYRKWAIPLIAATGFFLTTSANAEIIRLVCEQPSSTPYEELDSTITGSSPISIDTASQVVTRMRGGASYSDGAIQSDHPVYRAFVHINDARIDYGKIDIRNNDVMEEWEIDRTTGVILHTGIFNRNRTTSSQCVPATIQNKF